MKKIFPLLVMAILPVTSFALPADFVTIQSVSHDIVLDMKYATPNNFLKQPVYPCATCVLKKGTATALAQANQEFQKMGYRIKVFDCYRPLSVQKKMWQIMPNSAYVANPTTGGSKHNRGAAVDLTLVDAQGKELDMGTPFDYFGKQAHHSYTHPSVTVQKNRQLLKTVLAKYHFKSLDSEWWHYDYIPEMNAKAVDFAVSCTKR